MREHMYFPFEPVAQPRPKVTLRGRKAIAYVSHEHPVHNYRNGLAKFARKYLTKKEGPVGIKLVFIITRSKSNKKAYHCMKPDIDNFEKAVLDALNGIAYNDDSQVVYKETAKIFLQESFYRKPGVYIELFDLDEVGRPDFMEEFYCE